MSDPDKQLEKKRVAALLATILITESITMSGGIMLVDDCRRKKKTWIEKQQAKRGWQIR